MSADGPWRVFVYGTLLDDACVRSVTGRTFPRRPATLPGHRRVWPPGRYPYLVRDAAAEVAGAVLEHLDGRALAALDAYEDEGRLYVREEGTVTCDGEPVRAFVYQTARRRA